jgi:hypothetical protein
VDIDALIAGPRSSPEEALQVFDALEEVPLSFMFGRWRGAEIATGHRMEGMLEASGWYGKLFLSEEEVHPLLFYTRNRKGLFACDPKPIRMDVPVAKLKPLGSMAAVALKLLQTTESKARLRMTEHRGRLTAAMIYDDKPILDVFRKIDESRVLGLMDLKGDRQPYFFVLERDDDRHFDLAL